MARIRSLKPEIWQDEKIGRVSRDARLLFVVLITLADDEGRFRALPSAIIGHGYPYSNVSRKLDGWLDELAAAGLVVLYGVDGMQYGALPGWSKHQRVSHKIASSVPEFHRNGSGEIPAKLRRVS